MPVLPSALVPDAGAQLRDRRALVILPVRIGLFILSLMFFAGCMTLTSSRSLNRIQIGMTKQAVIAEMGVPTSTRASSGAEILIYNLLTPGKIPALVPDEYFVRLVGGQVDAFGRVGDFDSTKVPTQVIIHK